MKTIGDFFPPELDSSLLIPATDVLASYTLYYQAHLDQAWLQTELKPSPLNQLAVERVFAEVGGLKQAYASWREKHILGLDAEIRNKYKECSDPREPFILTMFAYAKIAEIEPAEILASSLFPVCEAVWNAAVAEDCSIDSSNTTDRFVKAGMLPKARDLLTILLSHSQYEFPLRDGSVWHLDFHFWYDHINQLLLALEQSGYLTAESKDRLSARISDMFNALIAAESHFKQRQIADRLVGQPTLTPCFEEIIMFKEVTFVIATEIMAAVLNKGIDKAEVEKKQIEKKLGHFMLLGMLIDAVDDFGADLVFEPYPLFYALAQQYGIENEVTSMEIKRRALHDDYERCENDEQRAACLANIKKVKFDQKSYPRTAELIARLVQGLLQEIDNGDISNLIWGYLAQPRDLDKG